MIVWFIGFVLALVYIFRVAIRAYKRNGTMCYLWVFSPAFVIIALFSWFAFAIFFAIDKVGVENGK